MRYLLVLVLFFSSLHADREGGPYIGVGYGVSQYNSNEIYNTQEDISRAISIYGGAYINKYLSVELGYIDFTSFSSQNGYMVDDTKTYKLSIFSVSTLVHYPIFNDKLDFYARFGAGQINFDDDSGFNFVFGVGVAIRFNSYLSLKFAYDKHPFYYDATSNNSDDTSMNIDYIYSAIEVQF